MQRRRVDILVEGGTIYDGSGAPSYWSDVAIAGDRIAAIGPNIGCRIDADRRISVDGLVVTPGFIDINTHSDLSVLINPRMESSIHQGVTTELTGNCGMSMGIATAGGDFELEHRWISRAGVQHVTSTFAEFFDRLEDQGVAVNVASLVGHNTLRRRVMGYSDRPPSVSDLSRMEALLGKSMDEGCFGLSTGLEYSPGRFSDIDEICLLAKLVLDAGGFYASHVRSEGSEVLPAIREAITVGSRTGIGVQVSHHKITGSQNWGTAKDTLRAMQEARDSGIDVLADQYPYNAYMTSLAAIVLPTWAGASSSSDLVERLGNPGMRSKLRSEIEASEHEWDLMKIAVATSSRYAQGQSILQLSRSTGKSPADTVIDLLIEEVGIISVLNFAMSDGDIDLIIQDPHTMIASDGLSSTPAGEMGLDRGHPRSFGTFPRFLGRYCRERGLVGLSEAVRRITFLPAERMQLRDRGLLKVGYKADIVVFDADRIRDTATYVEPNQFPIGIEYVFVNGCASIVHGKQTAELAGRVLRRGVVKA